MGSVPCEHSEEVPLAAAALIGGRVQVWTLGAAITQCSPGKRRGSLGVLGERPSAQATGGQMVFRAGCLQSTLGKQSSFPS